MTLKDYFDSCKAFAADSSFWGGLDPYKHYVAVPYGGWVESCDNQENGISLSWAFGISFDRLTLEAAKEHYCAEFQGELELANDDEWDDDQRRTIYEKFSDCVDSD